SVRGNITNQGNLAVGIGQTLTLYGNTVISSGTLTAPGGTVQVLGNQVGLFDQAIVDVSSPTGGGTVRIGGDFQGGQGTIGVHSRVPLPTASRTYVSPNTVINADALETGNGGTVIIWADETTRFYGTITARGTGQALGNRVEISSLSPNPFPPPNTSHLTPHTSSNGGFVEVSGKEYLDFQGQVDTSAPFGQAGTLLLDPTNIEVVALLGNTFSTSLAFADAPFPTAQVSSALMTFSLSNIVLQATNNITVNAGVNLLIPGVSFTAQAGNNIVVNNDISTLGGDIRLIANDPSSGAATGAGSITINNASFTTSGGDVVLQAAGDISLNAITNDARVQTSGVLGGLFGGDGGNVTVQTPGTLRVQATNPTRTVQLATSTFGVGDAGNMVINAGRVEVSIPANSTAGGFNGISTQSLGSGDAGNITINTQAVILQNGVQIASSGFGSGDAGDIALNSQQLTAQNGAAISASGANGANAGDISIQAQTIDLQRSFIAAVTINNSPGNAGQVDITTNRLTLQDGSIVSVQTGNSQAAGKIVIQAREVELSGSGLDGPSRITAEAASLSGLPTAGNGGEITIATTNLLVQNGARIYTDALLGTAGDITIRAADTVTLTNGNTDTITAAGANGGNISLTTGQLQMQGAAAIASTVLGGGGSAGDVTIQARRGVTVSDRSVIQTSTVSGTSGNLLIQAPTLLLQNQAVVSSGTFLTGTAGNLTVRATESVTVESNSTLSTIGIGLVNGGTLTIETGRLRVDNANINTAVVGQGNGGNLSIAANTVVTRNGTITTALTGQGSGGNLDVTADTIVATDGGGISTGAVGAGSGNNLTLATRTLTILNGASVNTSSLDVLALEATFADFLNTIGSTLGPGFSTPQVTAIFNAIFTIALDAARSAPQGSAGALSVQASEGVTISGLGSLSTAARGNTNAGQLTVQTGDLTISDRGLLISLINGNGRAGDITLQANNLTLTNLGEISSRGECSCNEGSAANITLNLANTFNARDGLITATSFRAGGGNIAIQAEDIRLQGSSLISTSVFDSTGGGGNISINSTIFLALNDSDILANAELGPGGNITINSPGFLANLFGTGQAVAVGRNPGSFGQFRGNSRVDISAASAAGVSGIVTLPNLDISRGLVPLPEGLGDASNQIAQACKPGQRTTGSFVNIGRGGIPESPYDFRGTDEVWEDLGGVRGTESGVQSLRDGVDRQADVDVRTVKCRLGREQ
ncbi:MAG: hypothetical protein NZ772_15105, partial [Cyanobacteria bacterium]|nr:hypothetical protein [Cyanobacteriota bacterium]MDW8202680.1 hypothetical protein [Cyanobacteriota bacterium SKYGB_h_bin112]